MKRYIVYAKRKDEKEWTPWADTNEIMRIEKYVSRIRELGYEALVTDPAIEECEKKLKKGYLIETPAPIGQPVFAVVEGKEPCIEEWTAKELHYDGEVWTITDTLGIPHKVSRRACFIYKSQAERLLRKLKGETDNED